MGKFWAYDGTPALCAPPRLYNMIARTIALQQKMLTVPDIARLFALVNVAMADAGIASWDTKFFYQYWRPVTAIRLQRDPNFYPLGAQTTNTAGPNFTPPFPAYTSGHATFGGALFQILRNFSPDETTFTFVSDEWNGKNKDVDGNIRPLRPASFKSFTEAEWKTRKAGFTWASIGTSTPRWASSKAIRWPTMFSTTPSGPSTERKRAHEEEGAAPARFGVEYMLA